MSFKIVDQIKKSPLPRPLKTVLEAYVTFANRDGTSIRPTEAKVALRASASRSTVSRHTQTLVGLGLLVHDLDEHGIWLKHAYGEDGMWAYCYHIDASKLHDPALVAQWKADNERLLEKRRIAGAKNIKTRWAKGMSGNPTGQSKMLTTPPEQIAVPVAEQNTTPTSRPNCYTDPTPKEPDQNDDPSAVSTAVSQNQVSELVSEDCSVASLPYSADGSKKETTFDQDKQKAKEEAFAEAMQGDKSPILPKSKYDHDLPLWLSAEELFNSLWPDKPITEEDTALLIDLAMELDSEVDWVRPTGDSWHWNMIRGGGIIQEAWTWNQIHKKGKYRLFSLAELAKALRSTSDRNLLAQMRAHEGCNLCEGVCEQDRDNNKSKVMDNPLASAAPPISLCPHGNDWGFCQICMDEEAKRNLCQHGNHSATCYECSHPPNTTCKWKECGKWFYAGHKQQHFCSSVCKDKFHAREKELKAKYAPKLAENHLAAFLDGRRY